MILESEEGQVKAYVNNHGQDQSAQMCTLSLAMSILFVTRVEMHLLLSK